MHRQRTSIWWYLMPRFKDLALRKWLHYMENGIWVGDRGEETTCNSVTIWYRTYKFGSFFEDTLLFLTTCKWKILLTLEKHFGVAWSIVEIIWSFSRAFVRVCLKLSRKIELWYCVGVSLWIGGLPYSLLSNSWLDTTSPPSTLLIQVLHVMQNNDE